LSCRTPRLNSKLKIWRLLGSKYFFSYITFKTLRGQKSKIPPLPYVVETKFNCNSDRRVYACCNLRYISPDQNVITNRDGFHFRCERWRRQDLTIVLVFFSPSENLPPVADDCRGGLDPKRSVVFLEPQENRLLMRGTKKTLSTFTDQVRSSARTTLYARPCRLFVVRIESSRDASRPVGCSTHGAITRNRLGADFKNVKTSVTRHNNEPSN